MRAPRILRAVHPCLLLALILTVPAVAQIPVGSIEGTVRDASGAVLESVSVTVTDEGGRRFELRSGRTGRYQVQSLPVGAYIVEARLRGFKTAVTRLFLKAGSSTRADLVLHVGEITEQVVVTAHPFHVDTAASSVFGTIDAEQIREVPLQGRNFLDALQLEPGVQLVDAGTDFSSGVIRPKRQFAAVSVAGRSGRTTRITVDGIDISDEMVGSTVQNLSPDSIQEMQLSQSTLDPSTSITSSGAVSIVTRRGGNRLSGGAFLLHRDDAFAALPVSRTGDARTLQNLEDAQFDRQHLGFQLGGPIRGNRLFFFANYEYLNQDGATFVFSQAFPQWNGPVETPFNDHTGLLRLDWNVSDSATSFFRFTHETSNGASGFGGAGMAPEWQQYVSNLGAAGLNFSRSTHTHSLRYGHTFFQNEISSISLGLPEFQASNGVTVSLLEGRHLFTGPISVPQTIFQTGDQFRYDGSWAAGNHQLRFGVEVHWIRGNIFFGQFSLGPTVFLSFSEEESQRIRERGGDPANPLEYPLGLVIMGNGRGFFTERASHGNPFGGVSSTRIAGYVSGQWRIGRRLNLNLGLRYGVDTGQVNDDLGLPRELIGVLGEGGIRPPRVDRNNFAPQIGLAWQPWREPHTVVRAGGGLFYETQLFTNTIFDRANRLPVGLGPELAFPPFGGVDSDGRVVVNGEPVNAIDTRTWAGASIASVIDQIGLTFSDYQSATRAAPFDPSGVPAILAIRSTDLAGGGPLVAHDYTTPYTIQSNVGVQHRFGGSWVLSADFVRHRSVHHNVLVDANASSPTLIDAVAAQARIDQVLASRGLGSIDEAIEAGLPFRFFGLDGFFVRPDPDFFDVTLLKTIGTSTYKALQLRLRGRLFRPFAGLRQMDLAIGYALGRYSAPVGDQDSINGFFRGDNSFQPGVSGPSGLDRTHQLTVQLAAELPWGLRMHVRQLARSPLASTLRLPFMQNGSFTVDLDGDGLIDFFPATERGAFGRTFDSVQSLNAAITEFNSTQAGTLTTRGQTLVQAGLFTEEQLRAFGLVVPALPLAPGNQVLNDSFLTTDIRLAKVFRLGERLIVLPMVEVFNVFNIANYQPLSGELSGALGTANGTPPAFRTRVGLGSGSFGQGIPRAVQFGIRFEF